MKWNGSPQQEKTSNISVKEHPSILRYTPSTCSNSRKRARSSAPHPGIGCGGGYRHRYRPTHSRYQTRIFQTFKIPKTAPSLSHAAPQNPHPPGDPNSQKSPRATHPRISQRQPLCYPKCEIHIIHLLGVIKSQSAKHHRCKSVLTPLDLANPLNTRTTNVRSTMKPISKSRTS